MSTISASTTLTTAYSVTGDTTGTLVFQTGASPTTAMTISSAQGVTFAGTTSHSGLATFSKGSSSGITIGDVSTNSNSVLRMQGTSAGYNWQIANNLNVAGIEFTPSTATGGTTYTTPAVSFLSNGNVGIGTSSPNKKLEVGSLGAFRLQTGSVTMDCTPTAGATDGFVWNTSAASYYDWAYAGSVKMRIDSSGNVGIGTSSPTERLTIAVPAVYGAATDGNINIIASASGGTVTSPTTVGGIVFGDKTATNSFGGRIAVIQNNPNGSTATYMPFYTNTGGGNAATLERMRIDTSGNLLVGTTTAGISGYNTIAKASASIQLVLQRTSASPGIGGIGADDAYVFSAFDSSTTRRFAVTNAGSCQNTTGSYGSFSDIKLKENIEPARNYLEDLCKVNIVKYSLKSEKSAKANMLGVIAQELEAVFPNMIEDIDDFDGAGEKLGTKSKAVKYSVFVPMLIKAIQELNAKVDAQTAEIAALKGQ